MRRFLVILILMGCFVWSQAAKTKPQPTGLNFAATWDSDTRDLKIRHAQSFFGEKDEVNYLIYKKCVMTASSPTLRPTKPSTIKICNDLIDQVEKEQSKQPKW